MINELINLANYLDESGFKKEADQIDAIIKKHSWAQVAVNPAILWLLFLMALLGVSPQINELLKTLIEQILEATKSDSSGLEGPREGPREGAESVEDAVYEDGPSDGQTRALRELERALEDISGRENPGDGTTDKEMQEEIDRLLKNIKDIMPTPDRDSDRDEATEVRLYCFKTEFSTRQGKAPGRLPGKVIWNYYLEESSVGEWARTRCQHELNPAAVHLTLSPVQELLVANPKTEVGLAAVERWACMSFESVNVVVVEDYSGGDPCGSWLISETTPNLPGRDIFYFFKSPTPNVITMAVKC